MKTILVVNFGALIITGVTAVILAWANRASSTVALATGALLGAAVLYGVQLLFELRRTIKHDHISTEFAIDRAERWIRQWAYPEKGGGWRPAIETEVGRSLENVSPTPFDGDRDAVTRDFMVRSVIAFLGYEEFDWQLNKRVFRGPSGGTLMMSSPVSTEKDATLVSGEAIQAKLTRSGNLFSRAPVSLPGRLPSPPTQEHHPHRAGFRAGEQSCIRGSSHRRSAGICVVRDAPHGWAGRDAKVGGGTVRNALGGA